jgi:hypothetical protein
MDRYGTFEIQAIAFAVFWFINNLRILWDGLRPYNEKRATKIVEDVISAAKRTPFPRLLPGLYIAIWLLHAAFDVIGLTLIFSFSNGINWIIKVLAVSLLVFNVDDLRQTIVDLRTMENEQKFRQRMLDKLKPKEGISIIQLGRGMRLVSSIALFVVFYLWKYQ